MANDQKILRWVRALAKRYHADIERGKGGHFKLTLRHPNGNVGTTTISASPSDGRSNKNAERTIERVWRDLEKK